MTKTTLYVARTTFLGTDRPSRIYFDTKQKALDFLRDECENGEVIKVEITSDYELNYSDRCSLCDLTFGEFDVEEIELD